jgi:ComF family protein
MKTILKSLTYLLFPEVCLACGNSLVEGEKVLCTSCEVNLPRTRFHDDPENITSQIFWGRFPVEAATSFLYFRKKGKVQKLIHQLKYQNEPEIGKYLGQLFGLELKKSKKFHDADMLIPVPLHPKKQRIRGYNQSELIAQGIAVATGIPLELNNLVRTQFSETQTRKNRFDRWKNVASIFSLNHPERVRSKKIILIDDVLTTGSTLEASAMVFPKSTRICIATLATAHD